MATSEQIAIIGYGFRAPDGSHRDLWTYLAEAKCAWSTIPQERFDHNACYHPDPQKQGTSSIRGGHFLQEDVFAFDAPFFNISPQEAKVMDPQHRMLLECAYEAIEQSGTPLSRLSSTNVGVFAAGARSDYEHYLYRDPATMPALTALGTTMTMFANRLSYCFDLKGPSVTTDTACSSSITALHLACESLKRGECSSALVGASSLVLSPEWLIAMSTLGAMGSDGRCYSYDARGSGYGRGEGAVCLLLKPLSAAIAAGDPIRAVVRNTAINQDGHTQGITLPNGAAQVDLLRRLYSEAQLSPADTIYVEGHGTGTAAGDPIEADALLEVFGPHRTPDNPLYIGSVKSNFGHLENASGLISMIKVILMLENGCILPNADFQSLHPNISSQGLLQIPQSVLPWPIDSPKRVCLNNFGYGGSNAAAIIEAAEACHVEHSSKEAHSARDLTADVDGARTPKQGPEIRKDRLLVLSAKNEASLRLQLTSLGDYLREREEVLAPEQLLNSLAYTLGEHRSHHVHRWTVAANCTQSLASALADPQPSFAKVLPGKPCVAFLFTGQGSQYPRMAVELKSYRVFDDVMRVSSDILKQFGASWNLQEELEKADDESRVNEAAISQPACTAVQIALVDLLQSWGVKPDMVTGHSSGEIAAAYAAGSLTLESALAIAYYRGVAAKAVQDVPGQSGAMVALGASPLQAEELLEEIDPDCGEAGLAAVNSPESVTLSGDAPAIDAVADLANEAGLFARKLKVDVAYHSQHMTVSAQDYRKNIAPLCEPKRAGMDSVKPGLQFFSSVTGTTKAVNSFDARYWVANLTSRVQFDGAMQEMLRGQDAGNRPDIVLEIGPHAALKSPIHQIIKAATLRTDSKSTPPQYHSVLQRGKPADESAVTAAGFLFGRGVDVDLAAVNRIDHTGIRPRLLTDLPPYSWNKAHSFVHSPRLVDRLLHPKSRSNALLGRAAFEDMALGHTFRNVFTLDDLPWLRDHKVGGHVVFPFAAYLVMAIEALKTVHAPESADSTIVVREMRIDQALWIFESDTVELRLTLQPCMTGPSTTSSTKWSFTVSSWDGDKAWTQHTCGQIMFESTSTTSHSARRALDLLRSPETGHQEDIPNVYHMFDAASLEYGKSFRGMQQLWRRSKHAAVSQNVVANIEVARGTFDDGLSTIHPATLDAFLHPLICLLAEGSKVLRPHVPTFVSQIHIKCDFCVDRGQRFRVAVERSSEQQESEGQTHASVIAFSEETAPSSVESPVVKIDGITLTPIGDARNSTATHDEPPESYIVEHFELVDLLPRHQLDSMLKKEIAAASDSDIDLVVQQDAVALHFISAASEELAECARDKYNAGHLQRLALWAGRLLKEQSTQNSAFTKSLTDPRARESVLERFASASAASQMICEIGRRLPQILHREIEPLDVMVKDGLLARTYSEDVGLKATYPAMAKLACLLSKTNPMLKVLEIGAGTGGATEHLLHAMSIDESGPPNFLEYTFTDVSTGFFENARQRLAKWSRQLKFAKLDVGEDPTTQGFPAASYDLVIAANVLHATPDITLTLRNVHSLLKPGGKLLLQELTCPRPRFLAFSTLPGWWLCNDEFRSDDGPLLSEDSWNLALRRSGFTGVDSCVYDFPGISQQCAAVITSSRAPEPENFCKAGAAEVQIFTFNEPEGYEVVSRFIDLLQGVVASNTSVAAVSSATMDKVENTVKSSDTVIIVDNPNRSVFTQLSATNFAAIKAACVVARRVLWVAPSSSYPSSCPESQMCEGLLRTLNAEGAARNAVTVQLDSYNQTAATRVADILTFILTYPDAGYEELEYTVDRDGSVRVPRMVSSRDALDAFKVELDVPVKQRQPLWQPGRPLELTVDDCGGLDSLHWADSRKMSEKPMGDDDILVRTEAAGLNFVDLMRVLGQVPWKKGIGLEGAGVIEKVGRNVTQLQIGDRVCYMEFGGSFATHNILPAAMAAPIPDEMDIADAATRPVTLCTAILALEDLARLRKGESVLIHAATGGVGQFAVQIALYVGATVYATAGTEEKRQYLHDEFGIPHEHIFSSRDAEFANAILTLTDGEGVDVVLNSLAGELLQKSWSVVAEFGRFVEIGKRDLLENSYLETGKFLKNAAFFGLHMDEYSFKRPELLVKVMKRAMEMFQLGIVKAAKPLSQYRAPDIIDGFRKLQLGKNMGKIAFVLGYDDVVTVRCRKPFSRPGEMLLRGDVSYVITGGTGGLGRSIVGWMIRNGARNILLLSRSGSLDDKFAPMWHDAAKVGATVKAAACDVSDRDQVIKVLEDTRSDMPPVAGVIHGALVLRDALFTNSSHDDWQQIMAPKVQGAWNLHHVLKDNKLDFFVSLASLTGVIGNVGQAIYAATTTFLESFAKYRRRLGLPAVTIDLSSISQVGYAAERGYAEDLTNIVGSSLNEAQLHIVLKGAIIGDGSPLHHDGVSISGIKILHSSLGDMGAQPWARSARARYLVRAAWAEAEGREGSAEGKEQQEKKQRLAERLAQAGTDVDAARCLVEELVAKVSSIMMIERDDVTGERPMNEYGLDSLVSVELRNWIRQETQSDLPLTVILGSENLSALGKEILRRRKETS